MLTFSSFFQGPYGVNHGVEFHADVAEYAQEKLEHYKRHGEAFDEHELCEPQFVTGNCLLLPPGRLYDRVYCGAACPPEHENYMKNLIRVGGILVMPFNDQVCYPGPVFSSTSYDISWARIGRDGHENTGLYRIVAFCALKKPVFLV